MEIRPRFSDPYLNRFLQPDSITPNIYNPQNLNKYSYVNNSPIGNSDPSGHCMVSGHDFDSGSSACQWTHNGQDSGDPNGSGGGNPGGRGGRHGNSGNSTNPLDSVTNAYMEGWHTFGSAWNNDWNPSASYGSKMIGNAYMSWWLGGHAVLGAGAIMLANGLIVPSVGICSINPNCEDEVSQSASQSGTQLAQTLGKAGETASQILKNTIRIPSASGTAAYRIPDQLLPDIKLLSEVKNVANLSLTNQLSDFLSYAQENNYSLELWTRTTTTLSGPLQAQIGIGNIIQKFLP